MPHSDEIERLQGIISRMAADLATQQQLIDHMLSLLKSANAEVLKLKYGVIQTELAKRINHDRNKT